MTIIKGKKKSNHQISEKKTHPKKQRREASKENKLPKKRYEGAGIPRKKHGSQIKKQLNRTGNDMRPNEKLKERN